MTANTKEEMEAPIFIRVLEEDSFYSRRSSGASFFQVEYIVKLIITDAEVIKGSRNIKASNATSDLIVIAIFFSFKLDKII